MKISPLVAIDDFCLTGSGGTPNRANSRYFGGSIPWVKSGELREGIILDTEEKITELALKESSAKLIPSGTILLAMYGATVGRMAFLGIDAATNQAICNIRPDPQRADPRYVFHGLQAKIDHFLSRATGGAQPNISQGIIRETKLPLPPLPEQRRIAAILDKADALRRKRERAIELLDSLTQSIFLEMFGDPVSNPKSIPSRPLAEVARFTSGGTPSKQVNDYWTGTIPWVSPKDMKVDQILDAEDHIGEKAIEETTLRIVEAGSTLIVVRGMILAHTAPIAIARRPVTINQDMKAIWFDDAIDQNFGFWCLKAQARHILSKVSSAAHGTKRLDMSDISQLRVIVPERSSQQRFVAAAAAVTQTSDHMEGFSENSTDIFSSLQSRAFSGQL